MTSAVGDERVFVRSMAHRGHSGGLARTTHDVADVLDAFGCETVLVETVGVGQGEIDVAEGVDETVVVLFPGAGDEIQVLKAGILEVADILFVNKSDLPGAADLAEEVRALRSRSPREGGRDVPVLLGSARTGDGIDALVDALVRHREADQRSGRLARRRAEAVRSRVRRAVAERVEAALGAGGAYERALRRAEANGRFGRAPDTIAEDVFRRLSSGTIARRSRGERRKARG
jgi:LAO/AO transport system kinase